MKVQLKSSEVQLEARSEFQYFPSYPHALFILFLQVRPVTGEYSVRV